MSKYVKVYHSVSKYVEVHYSMSQYVSMSMYIYVLTLSQGTTLSWQTVWTWQSSKWNERKQTGRKRPWFPWLDLTHRAHFSILELRMLEEPSPFEERRAQQQAEREAWACAVSPCMFLRLFMMQEDTRISLHLGWYIYIYILLIYILCIYIYKHILVMR